MEILQVFIDRRHNAEKFRKIRLFLIEITRLSSMKIVLLEFQKTFLNSIYQQTSNQHVHSIYPSWKRSPSSFSWNQQWNLSFQFGRQFLSQLYCCLLMNNNTKEIFYAIYCLINLVTIEASDQDTLVDFIHFCLKIQTTIIQSIQPISFCIHALIAAYFNLISQLYKMTEFTNHVDQVNLNHNHRLKSLFFFLLDSSSSWRTCIVSTSTKCLSLFISIWFE